MEDSSKATNQEIKSIAVIGNYLPRKCGIATFTSDLVESLSSRSPEYHCQVLAMNDNPEGYDYPEKVRFEINQGQLDEYLEAADFLNINRADMVCLQHEYGIFGGPAGRFILELLYELQMPIVTTLHTVLAEPERKHRDIMKQLADLSDRLVVMSKKAVDILQNVYKIPKEKIAYIPHGIPDTPFVDPNYYKEKFDLLGRDVLLTFGLLSESKGIEYVIEGLPSVVEQFPDLAYVVLGATHPHVLENKGEQYRSSLKKRVEELNLQEHVIFENHFVEFDELCEYLSAADLYVTPYINEDQITSGTLAYAMGTGKAVISTPYWYAKEMLDEGRGRLVPFKDAGATGEAISDLLDDDALRHQMRKRAYDFNRDAVWKEVAGQYMNLFEEVKSERNHHPRLYISTNQNNSQSAADLEFPALDLRHLQTLTDNTGILQHATYTIPNRDHGYCTDDNARALIVAMKAIATPRILPDRTKLDELSNRYLEFLLHAYNDDNGRFRNFLSYEKTWLEKSGSEDAHGRALWSLGITASLSSESPRLPLSSLLFMKGLEQARAFQSPRAIAYTVLGTFAYLRTFPGDAKARRIGSTLAERLFSKFFANMRDDWPWPEDRLCYSNGKLPHALIVAGQEMKRTDITETALRALEWLMNVQTDNGILTPVGNNGWYTKNGDKARFDQQPIEGHSLLEACITAYKNTGADHWLDHALRCFDWFRGQNDLNRPLYNAETGGCRDGLQSHGVNQNEGAESTLSWLLSVMAMHQLEGRDAPDNSETNSAFSYAELN